MKSTTPHSTAAYARPTEPRVAVIGAGLAGASCAQGLRSADAQVVVFERAQGPAGRMASRQATWTDEAGILQTATFDHGSQCFTAVRPRFRSFMSRAVAEGRAARWSPVIHAARPVDGARSFVPVPTTPALCAGLLAGSTLHLGRNVRRLQRAADGTWFVASDGAPLAGPFDHVVLAVPPAQAAVLLAGHHDDWAALLQARRMEACWTLMAATDDADWPWDAAEPDRGPLAWVARNDRMPGRGAPRGVALWTAHATAEWSAGRLDSAPDDVSQELQAALRAQLPVAGLSGQPLRWHFAAVHRWSHAGPALGCESFDGGDAWWDATLGLGVCGDWLAGGGVEAAWHSGDELADAMAAAFDQTFAPQPAESAGPSPSSIVTSADDHLVTG